MTGLEAWEVDDAVRFDAPVDLFSKRATAGEGHRGATEAGHYPHDARRVAMITEGTYPCSRGGVSVWCDQVVRQLPDHEFSVHALVGSGDEAIVWSLPDNVSEVQLLPLWPPGLPPTPQGRRPSRSMIAMLQRLFAALCTEGVPGGVGASIAELIGPARSGELASALAAPRAFEVLLPAMAQMPALRSNANGVVPDPTVGDALEALLLLEHMLRPLGAPVPQVDVCHCVSGGLGTLWALAAKAEADVPFLLGEHGLYLRERLLSYPPGSLPHHVRAFALRFFTRLTEAAYEGADLIVPVCDYNRLWEEASGAELDKISPVHNGIEPGQFPPPPPEPVTPNLVWLGRLDEIKDVETLLWAFALIHRAVPAATLAVYGPDGDPAYAAWCRQLVGDLGVRDAVRFCGRVSPDQLAEAYHGGQIVLLTSISEGFPFSVLEAMASGRPVIATDVGGVREAVGDAGVLVAPRNPHAVANACIKMLADDDARQKLGFAGRLRVLEQFTLDNSVDGYRRAYSDLAARAAMARDHDFEVPSAGAPQPEPLVTVPRTGRRPAWAAVPVAMPA